MVAPKNHKPWKLLVLGLAWYMECHVLLVFVPRFHEKQPVQTRLAAHGQTGGRKKLALPPLTSPANPEDHVFIPLEDYGAKIEELFQGQEFVFIRGGVGVGKSTLGHHLGREHPETFVSVDFGDGEYDSWWKNIVEGIKVATAKEVNKSDTELEDALRLAKEGNRILVLDEAHTIFNLERIRTLLFKGTVHPKLLLLSASGEASTGMMSTTPSEITQKFFWTPTIPEVDGHFISQLEQAGVHLDEDSVEFFMKFCGGHRSIFMAAMNWVKKKQNGSPWEFKQTVTEVRDSMGANSWWVSGGILEGLAASRGVKVNGKFGNLDVVPREFVTILCEGPGQLPPKLRRDLTVCGFVQPVPEAGHKEFRKVDWTQAYTRYAVSNPVMASYYREQLKNFRGLEVRVDRYIPVSCLDLLLRAIPYLTFARVVGYAPNAAAASALSASSSPFEDQYNRAIIDALTKLGYQADSCESPTIGKVDVFVNIDGKTFSMEGIVADRGQQDHTDHRNRFDNPSLSAYSEATRKALFTIGSTERTVRDRVNATRAEGVEIIGLVPNVAHTRYHIFYRGAECINRRAHKT